MLGYIYRSVNQSLVDTEKLLKLLSEPTDINDKPDAPDLVVENGEIEFGEMDSTDARRVPSHTIYVVENVSFSYDGRAPALNNVSFKVPKGSSVALVGESGSGKSTILRLLYRFYDLKEGEGRILIDGKDIRDVTQASLRKAIGVVPQDSVLFNASIAYNIGCVVLVGMGIGFHSHDDVLDMVNSEHHLKRSRLLPSLRKCTTGL